MKPRNQLEFDFSEKAEPPGSLEQAGNPVEADSTPKKTNEAGTPSPKPRSKPRWEPPAPIAPPASVKPSPQSAPPPAPALSAPPDPPSGEAPALAPVPFFPPPPAVPDALGIRMVNEYVYCPRLFYYETVESVFVHSRDTLEGKEAHKRVDTAKPGKLPKAKASGAVGSPAEAAGQNGDAAQSPAKSDGSSADAGTDSDSDSGTESGSAPATEEETIHARSVELSSSLMHLTAKLDLVEGTVSGSGSGTGLGNGNGNGGMEMLYTPVEYKKGRPREDDDGRALWDADKVQLILQMLLLRENGYPSEEGIVYYRETRQRVTFRPTEEDTEWARRMAAEAHATRRKASMPPPLDHSPKCPRCSLAGICLPDETRLMALSGGQDTGGHAAHPAAQLDLDLNFGSAPPPHHTSAGTQASTRLALMDYVLSQPAPGIRRVKVDPDLRRLIAPNPETRALYLNTPGTWVGKKGETVTVKEKEKLIGEFLLKDLHHVALFGPVQISTGVVQSLCMEEIPLTYFSTGGWFYGITRGHTLKNVLTRIEQFRAAGDPLASLQLARRMIHGKIVNQRTLLMRNHLEPPRNVLHSMKYLAHAALMATGLSQLLGVEGHAAALYFSSFGGMLKPKTASATGTPAADGPPGFQAGAGTEEAETDTLTDHRRPSTGPSGTEGPAFFPFYPDSRNRRPPRDPVNALLSLTYSLLAKECTLACYAVGLDPYVGVLHQPRHGRPALALDLMEEFRPLLADSTVITLVNNGMLTERDFVISSHAAGLTPNGRKTVLNAWERRLADPVTHPLFGYKVSYRRAVELQTRIFAKSLTGEIPEYIPFMTR